MRSFIPNEYITKKAVFCNQTFFINQNVLIPRQETEEIIDLVPKSNLIADVGTGCGCIGITLAEKFPQATIYLSDISDKALEVAKKNSQGETIIKSDLLNDYPKDLLFDVIVANLPYVPTKRIPRLLAAVRKYEPHIALDGGPKGTTLINKLIQQLPAHLKVSGSAILEIDDTHRLSSFYQLPNSHYQLQKDKFGRNRFLLISLR